MESSITATSWRCRMARRTAIASLHAFEHPLIKSGSEYTVFDLPDGFRVGVLICYDNNVNENGRIAALMGAEIMLAPHQTGGVPHKGSEFDGTH